MALTAAPGHKGGGAGGLTLHAWLPAGPRGMLPASHVLQPPALFAATFCVHLQASCPEAPAPSLAPTPARLSRDRSQPIWVSLSQGRTELYRDILQLELGNCPYLEE